MHNKAYVARHLDEMNGKINETLSSVNHERSALAESLRVVIPMVQEQNQIIRELLALIKE